MNSMLFVPLFLQGFFIFLDEILFHRKRGLPIWEIWGHPLDTLTVAAVYGTTVFLPYSENLFDLYLGLSIFSSVFVTKDEFIHANTCKPGEHWLHALLFVLHPTSFLCAYFLWKNGSAQDFLWVQFILVSTFLIYQILYWGKPWKLLLHTQTK